MTKEPALLPLAIVMVAGPQILTTILLATSENARKNSMSFVLGVAAAMTVVITLVFYVAKALGATTKTPGSSSGNGTVDLLVIALLLVLLVYVFFKRTNMKPPKWMSRLEAATPRLALVLGFVLFAVMPTDVITMVTVGSFEAAHDAPWWHNLYFIALTIFIISLPLLLVIALGKRADIVLPKIRDWMASHSWVVNEIVILLFLALTVSNMG